MLVRRSDPFRDLSFLQRHFDDLLNRGAGGLLNADGGETMANWAPSMDVIEKADRLVLRAELPGLAEDDVEITVDNNTLTLKGEKKFEHTEETDTYRRVESRYGSFYRSFSLPSTIDQGAIDAAFRSGVLEITLPKAEQAQPKKIAVTVN